ncbi:MAG: flavodoxin [Comamonadaceae bacterium]|nr:flavodoxin [Comamonadaceae bacterium]
MLERRPVVSRILVVYYSRSGHTDLVAKQIAALCHADLERIEDRSPRLGATGYLRSALEAVFGLRPSIARAHRNPGDYDLVIVGTPVWFWGVASPVRTWVHRHRAQLNRVAVFCSYGGSGHAKALDDLERLCRRKAVARLALTDRAVAQCRHDPALRRFLLEIKQAHPTPLPRPTVRGRVTV